ncbi:unnamed protein product [Fusarium venenatum]|uniref:Uncharacterized protein n=1 Tax=Fusarium venenatum TaxID=56646 RepID=A0A2L2TGH0_9HYPO|nr:uncharacterized protein FVRRES_01033 [Fusarium venenatum]CEI64521.1 unnamed protein product [Fusarium venenatum]
MSEKARRRELFGKERYIFYDTIIHGLGPVETRMIEAQGPVLASYHISNRFQTCHPWRPMLQWASHDTQEHRDRIWHLKLQAFSKPIDWYWLQKGPLRGAQVEDAAVQCFDIDISMLARSGSTVCIEPRNLAGFWKPSTQPHRSTLASTQYIIAAIDRDLDIRKPLANLMKGDLSGSNPLSIVCCTTVAMGLKNIENTISANYGDVAYLYLPL